MERRIEVGAKMSNKVIRLVLEIAVWAVIFAALTVVVLAIIGPAPEPHRIYTGCLRGVPSSLATGDTQFTQCLTQQALTPTPPWWKFLERLPPTAIAR